VLNLKENSFFPDFNLLQINCSLLHITVLSSSSF